MLQIRRATIVKNKNDKCLMILLSSSFHARFFQLKCDPYRWKCLRDKRFVTFAHGLLGRLNSIDMLCYQFF